MTTEGYVKPKFTGERKYMKCGKMNYNRNAVDGRGNVRVTNVVQCFPMKLDAPREYMM